MCAWNIFVQATLAHNPSIQVQLFSYQKNFCNLVRKFNFESCYLYDINQRTQLASQINTPSSSRTVSWDKVNDELHNIFLCDTQLPACYLCKLPGHYASACPYQFGTQPLTSASFNSREEPRNYKNPQPQAFETLPLTTSPHSFRSSQASSNNVQVHPTPTRNHNNPNFCYRRPGSKSLAIA